MNVRYLSGILAGLAFLSILPQPVFGQASVWTQHNDNARTGANLQETQLNTANVDADQFGKLFQYSVDSPIFAQPLVISNVTVPVKGIRNVLYLATADNTIYAYDADDPTIDAGQPIWKVRLSDPAAGVETVLSTDVTTNLNYSGPIGITGTPVIDQASGTLYVVARIKDTGIYYQRLHALDIATGQEKAGSPAVISASVPGPDGTNRSFSSTQHNQRPALALANGRVYAAWDSWQDIVPYQGWLMAFDAATLEPAGVFSTAPTGSQAGIWMSGQGPVIDANGNVYVSVANGTWDGIQNFAQSVLKLDPSLALLDWFTPDNWDALNTSHRELGSAGVLMIPDTPYLVAGGKEGKWYVLDSANMGKIVVGNGQIPQSFATTSTGNRIYGGPVYWNGSAGQLAYVWPGNDRLKAFSFSGQFFNTTPASVSSATASRVPGGILSLSGNGSTAGTGIVWAALPLSQDAERAMVPGVLRAFDATDVSRELWNSQAECRDQVGSFSKWVAPTVANGKVYLATFSGQVQVYGLLNTTPSANTGLSGSVRCSGNAVNLTATGNIDWAKWPNYIHKASGGSQISDYSVIGGATVQHYGSDPRILFWSDGAPTLAGSGNSGVATGGGTTARNSGRGQGFRISVPADPTSRTLYVYVGGANSSGTLTAHLSDSSAPDYVSSLSGAGQYDAVYALVYRADTAGQQLVVEWMQTSDTGNMTLQGAALSDGRPSMPTDVSATDGTSGSAVTVTWSVSIAATSYTVYRSTAAGALGTPLGSTTSAVLTDSTVTPGTVYYYAVVATNALGSSAPSSQDSGYATTGPLPPVNVSASDGTSVTSIVIDWSSSAGASTYTVYRSTSAGTLGSSVGNTNTNSLTDTTVSAGQLYYYSVVATNAGGDSVPSLQDSGYAGDADTLGAVAGVGVATFAAVNLTASGTGDWAKWPNYIHKASGAAQIANFTKIGTGTIYTYNNDQRPISWSDGTPTAVATANVSGNYIAGIGNGFQISAPADTTTRTLYVYVGGWKSGGTLVAHLSDNSAVDYVDSSFSSTTGQYKLVYTLTYRAASAGQRLVVNWTQASGIGNVTLQGAALAAGEPAGSLGGVGVATFGAVNLTASGTGDWAKWPNYIHKASGAAQIANFTKVGTGTIYTYNSDQRPISWSDGTPTAVATANVSGNYIAGIGNGFQISAPADTTTRTLYVYVGGWKSGGTLVAHLSDNSAVDYVDSSFSSTTGQYKLVYTLTYRAASAGQRLVVNWTQASGIGNVTLQGAALAAGEPAGSLGGVGVATFGAVNLTASGTGDWAKWPNYIHKASGAAQIANFTKIGTGTIYTYNNDQRPISWSDGTPTAVATANVSGNYIAGIGNGFQISAPADTTTRTLYVYVGGWKSGGTLVAHLSDNSAVDYVDSSFSSTTGQYKLVYTLTYRAASAGQRLVVNWTQASGIGNVTLQGAALK